MENREITSGLKNALDRGYSLEIAIQSFVNAGYNRPDVEDSAKALGYHGGIISHSETPQQNLTPISREKQETIQNIPQPQKQIIQQSNVPQVQKPITPQLTLSQPPKQIAPKLDIPQPTIAPLTLPEEFQIHEKSWFQENWKIVMLFVVLLALLGVLAWMMFFKS